MYSKINPPFIYQSFIVLMIAIYIFLPATRIMMGSFINFVFPVLFLVIMDIVYVRREEKILEDEFEDGYLDYKKRVRRWI